MPTRLAESVSRQRPSVWQWWLHRFVLPAVGSFTVSLMMLEVLEPGVQAAGPASTQVAVERPQGVVLARQPRPLSPTESTSHNSGDSVSLLKRHTAESLRAFRKTLWIYRQKQSAGADARQAHQNLVWCLWGLLQSAELVQRGGDPSSASRLLQAASAGLMSLAGSNELDPAESVFQQQAHHQHAYSSQEPHQHAQKQRASQPKLIRRLAAELARRGRLQAAVGLALRFGHLDDQDAGLQGAVEGLLTAGDLREASKVAGLIANPLKRGRAYVAIARRQIQMTRPELAHEDLWFAFQAADEMPSDTALACSDLLVELAEAELALGNTPVAFRLAEACQRPASRVELFLGIAEVARNRPEGQQATDSLLRRIDQEIAQRSGTLDQIHGLLALASWHSRADQQQLAWKRLEQATDVLLDEESLGWGRRSLPSEEHLAETLGLLLRLAAAWSKGGQERQLQRVSRRIRQLVVRLTNPRIRCEVILAAFAQGSPPHGDWLEWLLENLKALPQGEHPSVLPRLGASLATLAWQGDRINLAQLTCRGVTDRLQQQPQPIRLWQVAAFVKDLPEELIVKLKEEALVFEAPVHTKRALAQDTQPSAFAEELIAACQRELTARRSAPGPAGLSPFSRSSVAQPQQAGWPAAGWQVSTQREPPPVARTAELGGRRSTGQVFR